MTILFRRVLLICLSIVSLSASEIEADKPFKELIISYSHGLIKASQKSKFEHFERYMTKEIRLRTRVWIESFHYNDIFMDALFLGAKFSEFKKDEYSASMISDEIWKYRYINTKTKEILQEPTEVTYKLKYFFVLLDDGSWKINHIKILNETNKIIKK